MATSFSPAYVLGERKSIGPVSQERPGPGRWKMVSPIGSLTAGLVLALVLGSPASATPYRVDFTGLATFSSGLWAGAGTNVTGHYILDDAMVDSDPDPTVDEFTAVANPGMPLEVQITLGGITRNSASTGVAPSAGSSLTIETHTYADTWRLAVSTDTFVALSLQRYGALGPTLTGTPIVAPTMFLPTSGGATIFDTWNRESGIIHFQITGLSAPVLVPEPGTAALVAGGLLTLAMQRRAGTRRR